METTSTDNVMVRQESEDNEGAAMEPSHGGQQPWEQKQMIPTVVTSGDVISLQRDAGVNGAIVPYESTHPMTTRSRSRPIEETTDPEEAGARKKQVVASSTTGTTKRQRMVQGRAQADDDQLTIEGGQAMAATEDVPKTYQEATASGVDYEETYSRVAYLNSIRAMLAKCGADGMEIEQCDVDTAFLYGKLEEEIYMELPEGIRELLELAEAKGEDDVVCMLLQSLYGLKPTSRVWNETIDMHLKSMGFKPADADPCVYTRGEGEEECIVCRYVDDMLIASRQKTVIASVKAGIAEKFRIKDLGKARSLSALGSTTTWNDERWASVRKHTPSQSSRSLAKRMRNRA
ncbi:unnamed protein product [Phytophthora fragariaefolia]|uniref:Unnamed protein product n=1 Tax=Phytophthora fragariaefolia TaxID=1490495 RepID=A0A9W6Y3N4_9STRA|nr:unnamed protein product [Phytophthora fragariaefolia]